MTEHRDMPVGDALSRLPLPDHGRGYWRRLEDGVGAEAETLLVERDDSLGAALTGLTLPGHGDEYWQALDELLETEARVTRRARPRRWPRIVAAGAGAAAATFLVAAWFGLPGSVGGADSALARAFLTPLQESLSPPAMSGDTLLWMSRQAPNPETGQADVSIFALDLDSGATVAVSAYPSWKQQVTAGGDVVAWVDGRGGRPAVYAGSLGGHLEHRVAYIGPQRPLSPASFAASEADRHLGEPAISDATVVWTDGDGDIRGADLSAGVTFPIATAWYPEREPAVSGELVVWSDGRGNTWGANGEYMNGWEIYARDLATRRTFAVCETRGDQVAPSVSGNLVVWQDGRNRTTDDPDDWDVYACDVTDGREFVVAGGPGAQTNPAISGDLIVWTDTGGVAEPADSSVTYAMIKCHDLRTGRTFDVSDEPGPLDFASISSNRVVWSALGDGEMAIYGASVVQRGSTVRVVPLEPPTP